MRIVNIRSFGGLALRLSISLFSISLLTGSVVAQDSAVQPPAAKTSLSIVFESPARCRLSDLDLIRAAMFDKISGKQELLLSIEVLPAASESPRASSLVLASVDDFNDAVKLPAQVSLSAPQVTKPTLAGVFICKDSQNRKNCSTLKTKSFNELTNGIDLKQNAFDHESGLLKHPNKYKSVGEDKLKISSDEVFFFYPFVLKPGSLIISPANTAEPEAVNYLAKFLENESSDQLVYSRQAIGNLNSVPLEIKNGKLHVTVPHFECK